MKKIYIYDSTLRDGAQAQDISFSVEDKLKIVQKLDDFGVDYIEAGNPGSNPKDIEFFQKVKELSMKNAKLTAFGSTRKANNRVEDDPNVVSLLSAETPAVAVFGKSWDFHVTDILKTTLEENLNMIKDTIKFLKECEKEVIFDAEHFFDGFKSNKEYAIKTLEIACTAGADWLCLCETNGGCLPLEVYDITKEVKKRFKDSLIGIHCHNDSGVAVANSIVAVDAGCEQVQGVMNGFGERCGNANLSTIIPDLQLKKRLNCISEENLSKLVEVSRFIGEVANINFDERAPYVGNCAFAHKGGMHIDGVTKNPKTFEHINPNIIGNQRRFLMSEVSGRSTLISRIQEIDSTITKESSETKRIINKLKQLEHFGYQFEGAESSFELIIRKEIGKYKPFFILKDFKVIVHEPSPKSFSSSVMLKIEVDGVEEITAAEGDGPVNALDKALRKALEKFYPILKQIHLTDYKVRILDTNNATEAKTRVLIETTDGRNVWNTIGVSTNIIEASWIALVDSIEYKLFKEYSK